LPRNHYVPDCRGHMRSSFRKPGIQRFERSNITSIPFRPCAGGPHLQTSFDPRKLEVAPSCASILIDFEKLQRIPVPGPIYANHLCRRKWNVRRGQNLLTKLPRTSRAVTLPKKTRKPTLSLLYTTAPRYESRTTHHVCRYVYDSGGLDAP